MEAGSLNTNHRGYVIVVNHSADAQHIRVTTTMQVRSLSRIDVDGAKAVALDGSSWMMDLEKHEAAILEWKQ